MLTYYEPLRSMFQEAASPEDAVFAKKYMLNQFEFYGIRSADQKEIRKRFIQEYGLPEKAQLMDVIKYLWNEPYREFQYAGIDITERMLKKTGESAIEIIEFMITHKSWWDSVDWLAAHHAGTYFRLFPAAVIPCTGQWMDSENMWLQRSALLFQLKYKNSTNENLLFGYIQRLMPSKEFFIRKAIGWALREYSKTSPASVIGFVDTNPGLSGLSRREALKWIARSKSL